MSNPRISVQLRVDEVCDRFEAEWQAGHRPRLDEYLAACASADQPVLLASLVALDAEYRRRAGELPVASDYISLTGADLDTLARILADTPPVPDATDRTAPYLPNPDNSLQTGPVDEPPAGLASPVAGYEVLSELGRGGMGVVYHAREIRLNRSVALKMVLGADKADRKALIRFLAEAEAVAAIDHPNVVRVHRYGEASGCPYMALEYLPGGSLAGKLKAGGGLPVREAVDLVRRIARGVSAAHALGIVHRDLKPANVLLDAAGEPKVADFGLARRGPSDLTQTGAVMGTPAYMAPEQAKGENRFVGPGADVWALGVILFECLTGQRPFAGEDTWVVLQKVMADDPVRPRALVPQIPRDLELVCLKCLAKPVYERYPSADELANDLDRFAAGEPVAVRRAGLAERAVKWARRKPTLAALYFAGSAAVMLLAVGSIVAWKWRNEAEARAKAEIEQQRAEAAQSEAELAKAGEAKARGEAEIARDREQSAHGETKKAREELADQDALRKVGLAHREVSDANALGGLRLLNTVDPARREWEWRYVARLAQPVLRQFRADGAIMNVVMHPDGKRAFASCPEGVRVWEPETGKERTGYRGHSATVRYVVLHPDGKRAVSAAADGSIHVWEIDTAKRLREHKVEPSAEIVRLAISVDGKRLAAGNPSGLITHWDFETGQKTGELKGHRAIVYGLVFLPDGQLASGGFDKTLRIWDIAAGTESNDAIKHEGIVWAIAVGRDGKHFWTGDETGQVSRFELSSNKHVIRKEAFAAHPSRVWAITLSPDGDRMITCGLDSTARLWAIRDNSGERATVVAGQPVRVFRSHLSDVMDARFVGVNGRVLTCADFMVRLFDTSRDADSRVIRASSGSAGRALPIDVLAFSPDGQSVAGVAGGRPYLWDSETGRVTKEGPMSPSPSVTSLAFSEDGKSIAEGSRGTVTIRPVAGGEGKSWKTNPSDIVGLAFIQKSSRLATLGRDGTLTAWDVPSGKQVWTQRAHSGFARGLACSPDGMMLATCGMDRLVKLWSASDGDPGRVLTGHTHHVNHVAFSPDGTRLASASSDNTSRVWDVATGRESLKLHTRTHYVYAIAFSPDGRRLADASGDGTVTIYDARTGQHAITLKGHDGGVLRVAFSPNGARLASSGLDGTARIWDAPLDTVVDLPPGANESFDPNEGKTKK